MTNSLFKKIKSIGSKCCNVIFGKLNILSNIFKRINSKYNSIIIGKWKKVFQFLPNNLLLLLLFIITLFIMIPKILNNEVIVVNNSVFSNPTNPILNDSVYADITRKGLDGIKKIDYLGVRFATYSRKNDSIYRFIVYEDNLVVYSKKFNTKNLQDNKIKRFKVNLNIKKNTKYKVKLKPIKTDKNNSITVYIDTKTKAMQVYGVNKSPFNALILVLSLIFIIVFFMINYLINNKKISTNNFMKYMLIYIIPIMLITPPLLVPDETSHFYTAYKLSEYDFSKSPYKNFDNDKIIVPKNIECIYYGKPQLLDNVPNMEKPISCLEQKKENIKYTIPASMVTTSILYYIPSATIIRLVSEAYSSPLVVFYAGRIINFIIVFLILLKAIKITPKYKNMFILVGCIPVFIQQMISYSYDSLLNSCALLALAYFIKFYTQKELISKKDLIVYTITSFVLLYLKRVYFVIALFSLLIPNDRFKNGRKDKIKFLLTIIIIPLAVLFVANFIMQIGKGSGGSSKSTLDFSSEKLDYIMKQPLRIIKVACFTLRQYLINYLKEMIGVFGWLKYTFPEFLIVSYYIMLVVVSMSCKNLFKNIKQKLCVLVLILISVSSVFGVMYFTWIDGGLHYVEGFQGRYFIPLLLPLIMVFMPKKKNININDKTIYVFINIMMLAYIMFIMVCNY